MRKVYIAGPMRGYPNFNFDSFDAASTKLRHNNWTVISPAEIDRLHEGWGQYPPKGFVLSFDFMQKCIRRDVAMLLEFKLGDAIFLLDGWEDSSGTSVELALAKYLGLTILYESI